MFAPQNETKNVQEMVISSEEEEEPDLDGKFKDLQIANKNIRKLRNQRPAGEDYNVANLKKDLDKVSLHSQMKFIMGLKEKGEWIFYVATDTTKHPRRDKKAGNKFVVLHKEFVETRLSVVKGLRNFMQKLKSCKGQWIEMSKGFIEVYKDAMSQDRKKLIRKHGTYQRLRIAKNTIYGIVMMDGKELLADKLSPNDIRKRHLVHEVETLKHTKTENSWIELTHGASKEKVPVEYENHWPEISFIQGQRNTCLMRSLSSVLLYIKNTRDLKDNYINSVIDGLRYLSINIEPKVSKGKIKTVTNYMRRRGFFFTCIEPRKRKHNGIMESINVLSDSTNLGLFSLLQICGSDNDTNHTIMVCDGWIFDSNHERAMPLKSKYLDISCSYGTNSAVYESCTLMYRFEHKKIQKINIK